MEAAQIAKQAAGEVLVGLPIVAAPFWLPYFDDITHFILAGGGSVFVVLGIALRIREWLNGRK